MARDTGRPLRADAQRNGTRSWPPRYVCSPRKDWTRTSSAWRGGAGVGTGTLYRNFPTREALIEAAYRNEVARTGCARPSPSSSPVSCRPTRPYAPGRVASWSATAKLGMADALRAVVASGTNPYAESHQLIQAALTYPHLNAATAAGAIRADISPTDMFAALARHRPHLGTPPDANGGTPPRPHSGRPAPTPPRGPDN